MSLLPNLEFPFADGPVGDVRDHDSIRTAGPSQQWRAFLCPDDGPPTLKESLDNPMP